MVGDFDSSVFFNYFLWRYGWVFSAAMSLGMQNESLFSRCGSFQGDKPAALQQILLLRFKCSDFTAIHVVPRDYTVFYSCIMFTQLLLYVDGILKALIMEQYVIFLRGYTKS